MSGKARDWGEAGVVGSDEGEDFASLGAAAEGEWKDAIDIGVEDDAAVSGAAGAWKAHGAINGKSGEAYAETPGADPTVAWRQNPIPSDLVVAGNAIAHSHPDELIRSSVSMIRLFINSVASSVIYWAQLPGVVDLQFPSPCGAFVSACLP